MKLATFFCLLIGHSLFGQIELNNLKYASDKADEAISKKAYTKNQSSKIQFVNPLIGTGGHGHTYPGAAAPFGMVQLSPDTRFDGWDGCGGYHYSDSIIYGFSHTHLSGTGVSDYADLLLVPQSGKLKTKGLFESKEGYGDVFDHQEETAQPGYYAVTLKKQQIQVQLAATERAGMHVYRFAKSEKKYLLIDLNYRDQLLASDLKIIDQKTIQGHRISKSWANEQHFYFYLQTNTPYSKATFIQDQGQQKLALEFDESVAQIMVKVGISAVNETGAKLNLESEIPDWNFQVIKTTTQRKWNEELNKIEASFPTKTQTVIFYTALYHSFLNPNLFNDMDGKYRGLDHQIHELPKNERQYTVFSLWDTYRATHPLFTLVQQERTNHFIQTFLRQFDQHKDLPVWELAGNETDCMIGYHSVSVIADAYLKGIQQFDEKKALDAMLATANLDELGKINYASKGFINAGDEPESVSKTLEYAYDDFCIAQMAKAMVEPKIEQEYTKRSFHFINNFDPKTKFMRARRNASWYGPFDPAEVNFNYTEANSWQYSLYTPHAVSVLTELLGGKDSLEAWLDRLFTTKMALTGRDQADITGLIGQYAHGNEPSHHMAYLYNYTHHPSKTNQYIDQIQREMYQNLPDGLSGNEDCGQMSSWYVLSALGLYQIAPSHPWYEFGRPIVQDAQINLENGKKITIVCVNNNEKNKYIDSIYLDGKAYFLNGISHDSLLNCREIKFIMSAYPPQKERKANESALQIADLSKTNFIPAPYFVNETNVFDQQLWIEIAIQPKINLKDAYIEYRFTKDTTKLFKYVKPFLILESTEIEIRQVTNSGKKASPWINTPFIKRDPSIHLTLTGNYANQYAASGPNALIDGIKGGTEFRTGDWQGFQGQDVRAEIYFDESRVMNEIQVSCLQDMKSWIFYPKAVHLSYSLNGKDFITLGNTFQIPMFSDYAHPTKETFQWILPTNSKIKAIRVEYQNYGKCPEWHLGNGNDTWLFIDEIEFK